MTEHKFKVGDKVKTRTDRFLSKELSNGEGVIEGIGRMYLVVVPKMDDSKWSFYENELELIETAKPERYTGDLREGMRVMIYNSYNGNTLEQVRVKFMYEEWRLYDDTGGYYLVVRKPDGSWVVNSEKLIIYITSVISEQENTLSMHIGADGFAMPHSLPRNDGVTIKNSPKKGVIKNLMDSMFDLYLNNFDPNTARLRKYGLNDDGNVKGEVLFGALITWDTKKHPKFIDQLNDYLKRMEDKEKAEAKK